MANRKIGALWSRKTEEGKEYFSGVISDLRGDIQIVVFRNDKKANENQPDYDILLSEPKERGNSAKRSASLGVGELGEWRGFACDERSKRKCWF